MNFKGFLVSAVLAASVLQTSAQEWARFRGSDGSAISGAKSIPTKLSAGDINWTSKLSGTGHSSPVAWGEKAFLTTCSEIKGGLTLVCLSSTSGKELWKKNFALSHYKKHRYNSFASSTPALDSNNLYVGWSEPGKYTFAAISHEGDLVWQRDLGPYASQHGSGASAIIHEGRIIINSMKDEESFIIALDPKNGKTIWKTKRPSEAASYGSAAIYRPSGGRAQLLFTSQADGIFALAADTGKQLWQVPGLYTKRSLCSVTVAGDIVWGSCGSGGGGGNYVVALRAGNPEQGIKPERAWEIRRASLSPYVPTPVVQGQYAYLLSDAGFLSCVKHQTGEIVYSERVNTTDRRGSSFFSSPIIIDGRLFCLTTQGKLFVCQTGPEYKVLSEYDFDDICHATPAVHRGRLYIRTASKLFSIGG